MDFVAFRLYSVTVVNSAVEVDISNSTTATDPYNVSNPSFGATDWGWTIDPVGLRIMLKRFDERYNVANAADDVKALAARTCPSNDEDGVLQHLGSVVTNHGWSDWATTEIPAEVRQMWCRLSRREDDYRIDCSDDGRSWRQMRVCHLHEGAGTVRVGVYACSPEDSSFTARFDHLDLGPCAWAAHDGQQPDEE